MNMKITLTLIVGILLGFSIAHFYSCNTAHAEKKGTKVPPIEIPSVRDYILNFRKGKVMSSEGKKADTLYAEIHPIDTIQKILYDLYAARQVIQSEPGYENKEVYIGIYPYINRQNQKLSFYFIPTLGERGILAKPGTAISSKQITDYGDLTSFSTLPPKISKAIEDNIYNIGNHYP